MKIQHEQFTTELEVMIPNADDVLRQKIGSGRVLGQGVRDNIVEHLLWQRCGRLEGVQAVHHDVQVPDGMSDVVWITNVSYTRPLYHPYHPISPYYSLCPIKYTQFGNQRHDFTTLNARTCLKLFNFIQFLCLRTDDSYPKSLLFTKHNHKRCHFVYKHASQG